MARYRMGGLALPDILTNTNLNPKPRVLGVALGLRAALQEISRRRQ